MQQIEFNRTKIIATVGPSSNTKAQLKALIKAGADVFRLNFSHGTHEEHERTIRYVRQLNDEMNTPICLLQDLQGPKIRIEEVAKGTKIKEGQEFVITTKSLIGNKETASTSYLQLPKDVKKGDPILIDDGKLELKVLSIKGSNVRTRVVHGGKLKSRKGINLPLSKVSAPSLTPKDLEDLQFGLKHKVEWVALSFVRSAKDILEVRKIIDKAKKDTLIIAKIEKPEAVENIDEIISVSDGIMVARGDLGVEMLSEEVPLLQKKIVEKSRHAAKPVIIATQMMESMIENPRPTRAETNDVANAVIDGADVLMLSAETAAGQYPVEVVNSMVATIRSVERQADVYHKLYDLDVDSDYFLNDSVVHMGTRIANHTHADVIVGLTSKGYTAFKLASYRPKSAIFIFTHNKPFIYTLNMIWGVRAIYYDKSESTDSTIADIERILKKHRYVRKGDVIINLAAMPINRPGRVNALKIARIN